MSNNTFNYTLLGLLCLCLGVGITLLLTNTNTVVVKEPYEVVKEVVVEKQVHTDYETEAITTFLEQLEYEKNDKYMICGDNRYDIEQISVNKVFSGLSIKSSIVDTDDKDNANRDVISLKLRLKYEDDLIQEKCYKNYNIEVTNTEGEESVLKIK